MIYSDATHASPRQPQGIAGQAIGSSPGSAPRRAADPGIQTDKASAATAPATDDSAAAPLQKFPPPRPDFYGDSLADERASSADPIGEAAAVREDAESSRQQQAIDRAAGSRQQAVVAHLARIDAAKQRIPDFDQVIRSGGQVPIAPGVADEILNSEKSALLQYHLAGNPGKLNELNGLSGLNLAREIGRLESGLHLPRAGTVTEASPPLSDLRNGAAPVFDPVTTDDMDAFANWLREDQARRRRA